MHKLAKQSMLVFVALSLVMIPFASTALAQVDNKYREPGAGAMTYDLFLLRPFGALATVGGSAVFVLSPVKARLVQQNQLDLRRRSLAT